MNHLSFHKFAWYVAILFPPMANLWGNFSVGQRVFHAGIVLLLGMLLLVKVKSADVMIRKPILHCTIFALFVSAYFTATSLVNSALIGTGDIVEFIRPINYLVYFLFPVLLVLHRDDYKGLFKAFIVLMVVQVVFSFFVFIPEAWPIVDLYKGRLSTDLVQFHFFRFSGMLGYPSDFSFYLIFALLMGSLYLLNEQSLKNKLGLGCLCLIAMLALFLTGSRSGVALFVVLFSILLFSHRLILNSKVLFLSIALVVVMFYVIINDLLSENILGSFLYLLDLIERGVMDDSARHRIREFLLAIELMQDYFPFGFGANKDYFGFVLGPVESTYGYYMGKYGFIGICLYLFHIFYLAYIALQVSKRYRDDQLIVAFSNAFFIWALSVPFVFGFASAVTDRFKGPFLFYMLAGYLMSLYLASERSDKNDSPV